MSRLQKTWLIVLAISLLGLGVYYMRWYNPCEEPKVGWPYDPNGPMPW